MLQSLPVTMQTLPGSRPDISVGPGGCSGELLRLRNAHLIGVLRDLVEVPVDDVAGRPGERRCPVAEELRHDGERRGRDCSGVRQPLEGYAVRGLRASADGVGHVQEPVSRRCFGECLEAPRRSRWRGWIVHRSDHSRRTRPRYSRHWTRCDSRDSDALVTSASELIRMVRCGLVETMPRTWYSTIRKIRVALQLLIDRPVKPRDQPHQGGPHNHRNQVTATHLDAQ